MELKLADCVVFGLALLLFRWVHSRQSKRLPPNVHHPPGPPGMPLIGNLKDVPKHPAWLTYRRWSQEYSTYLLRCGRLA